MKNRLATFLGFALATIGVFVYLHAQSRAGVTYPFEGLTLGVYFSIMFAVGLFGGIWIFNLRRTPRRSTVLAGMAGFNVGLITWLLISILWLVPWMSMFKNHALVFISILIYCVGVVINRLPIYRNLLNNDEI